MSITINGKPHALEAETSVATLLRTLDVAPEQVAVAINGVVVRRVDWHATRVQDGDTVEVVRAVGGG